MLSLFKKDPQLEIASSLYSLAMDQSRLPYFYSNLSVPDTLEGRFDLLALHAYLIMNRLKPDEASDNSLQDEQRTALSQKVFDAMFSNLDDNLRQMGVGDLSVARKVRVMAEAFYGRVAVYDSALKEAHNQQNAHFPALVQALKRNVYAIQEEEGANTISQDVAALADYVHRVHTGFLKQPIERILAGIIQFPDPAKL